MSGHKFAPISTRKFAPISTRKSDRQIVQMYGKVGISDEDHENLPRVAMENRCLEYVVDAMHDSGKIDKPYKIKAWSMSSLHAPIMIAIVRRVNKPKFEVLAVAETVRRPTVSYRAKFPLGDKVICVVVTNGSYSWWFDGGDPNLKLRLPVTIVGSSFSKHEGLVTVNGEDYLLELHYNLSANAYFLQVPTVLFEAGKEYCFTTEGGMKLTFVNDELVDMELGNEGKANSFVTVVKF